jgi:hypothetical protein
MGVSGERLSECGGVVTFWLGSKGGQHVDTTRINKTVNGLRILQEDAPHAAAGVRRFGLFAPNYAKNTIHKVSTGIDGTAEALFRLIMDVERAPQWCVSSLTTRTTSRL